MTEVSSMRLIGPLMTGLLAALCFAWSANAEEAEAADPPSRVARLSYLEGGVQHRPADEQTWATAELNRPLTTRDSLWTENSARAELQLGFATVHLDEATNISLSELSDRATRLELESGTIAVNIKRLADEEKFEVRTSKASVSLVRPGVYRLEVREAEDITIVQVRSGQANVEGDRQSFTLDANERAEFRNDEEQARLAAQFSTAGGLDDFDDWASARNARAERAATSRYVAADVIGYEDLQDEGEWNSDAEFGYIWYPTRVAADWAPYRFGRWIWIGPWGWTWVDNARWGFAPFHYGRWVHRRSRWCWVPGPLGVRPVYAPALVAWMGHPGHRFGASFDVGWVPLGPREVYVPWHRTSRRYLHNINVSNTIVHDTYIDDVYRRRGGRIDYMNRHAPHGVSAVQQSTFTQGRPIADHLVRVNERSLRDARVSGQAPAWRPSRENWNERQVRSGPPESAHQPNALPRRNDGAFRRSIDVRNRWQTHREEPAANVAGGQTLGVAPSPEQGARPDRNWRNHGLSGSRRNSEPRESRPQPGADRPSWSTSRPNEQRSPRNSDPSRREARQSPPSQPSLQYENRRWERSSTAPSTSSSAPRSASPSMDRGNRGMREFPQRQPNPSSSGGRSWEPRSGLGERRMRER